MEGSTRNGPAFHDLSYSIALLTGINSIQARRQTSAFCGQDYLDIQDRVSYIAIHKQELS